MSTASAETITSGSGPPIPPPLVVLVAAQPEFRGLLTAYLLSRGMVPLPAAGGAHAEVICQAVPADIAFIVLPLADVDGVELVRRINARRPDVAIAVCAPPDPAREAHYLAAGAEAVMTKPLDLDDFDRTLVRLTASRRRGPRSR